MIFQKTEIRMVHMTPLTGGWPAGKSMNYGLKLMVDAVNANDLLLPNHTLQFTTVDDGCDPDIAFEAVLDLVFDKKTTEAVFYENMSKPVTDYREQEVTGLDFVGVVGCGCAGAAMRTAAMLALTARRPEVAP